MIFWMIRKARIKSGTMVNTARAHLSQQKIVHILGAFVAPILVDVTDSSEHWATDGAYVKVNCDATSFTADVGWIARDVIVILFRLKNLIFCVLSDLKTKRLFVLACFLFHNQVVVDSSRVCLGWGSVF